MKYISLNENEMWFGKTPNHWEIKRIGQLYRERKVKVSDKDYPPLSVTMKGIIPQMEHAAKTDAHDDRKLILKGDFVINSRSDRRGSCGISSFDGSCSLINTVLVPRKAMNPKYYNWFFHTIRFAEEFYRWGHGIVDDLWTTNYDEMKRIFLPVPTMEEQEKISVYLDVKCASIDEAINRHKSLIDKIENHKRGYIISSIMGIRPNRKLKDSNIVWMPKIIPLRFVFGERKHKNAGLIEKNLLTLSYGKIKRKDINSNEGLLPASFEGYNIVEKGDIVMRLLDLQNDWNSLRTGLVTERGIVTSAYVTLYPKRELNSAYFRYLLHSYDLKKVFYTMGEGIRQSLKYDDIGRNLLIPIPSMEEQNEIVSAIKEVETKSDMAIARHQQIIEKLEEYRKSIIYNAVTGKIDCRGYKC